MESAHGVLESMNIDLPKAVGNEISIPTIKTENCCSVGRRR